MGFESLPLIRGWRFEAFNSIKEIKRGEAEVTVYSKEVKGWLFGVDLISDDSLAEFELNYSGFSGKITPYTVYESGSIAPIGGGTYLSEYIKPSVLSTAGIYFFSTQFSSVPTPIVGKVIITFSLNKDSTQDTSIMAVYFGAIEIVDEAEFLKSLKEHNLLEEDFIKRISKEVVR